MDRNDLFCVFVWINRIICCGLVYGFGPFIDRIEGSRCFSTSSSFSSLLFVIFGSLVVFIHETVFMTICGFTSISHRSHLKRMGAASIFSFGFEALRTIRFALLSINKMRLSLNSMEIKTSFGFGSFFYNRIVFEADTD